MKSAWTLALVLVAFTGAPVLAQEAPAAEPPAQAEQAPPSDSQVAEGLFVSSTRRRPGATQQNTAACKSDKAKGDIVVCGADRGERYRVPSTTDSDPTAREALNTGVPHAPDVSSLPGCSRGCLGFGRAPGRVMTLNLADLPKTPKDSDADKIARGEMSER